MQGFFAEINIIIGLIVYAYPPIFQSTEQTNMGRSWVCFSINFRKIYMANVEELDKAIAAHGMWKVRLKSAIDTGTIDTPVATIQMDNQCAFGKWLYGDTMTSADKSSAQYKTVKELHAEFHKTAAQVAQLATTGKKADAEKMMASGGAYNSVSAKLTSAMMAWKNSSK
jgi:methyl-accepting chemotaxis protein